MSHSRSRRSGTVRTSAHRSLVMFLLVASFGILFVGCGQPDVVDEFVISDDEVAQFREMAKDAETQFLSGAMIDVSFGSGASSTVAAASGTMAPVPGDTTAPVIDLSQVSAFNALRTSSKTTQGNIFTVNAAAATLRAKPAQNAEEVMKLVQGDLLDVSEFADAQWAKAKAVANGKEGFVSVRLLAKMTTDDRLASEKKAFEGMRFVNYTFVNVRSEPNQGSEKLGTLPGQSIVKPISIDGAWAKIPFQGKEGYASTAYLAPFLPTFIVRQESYRLPILHYKLGQQGLIEAMEKHLARLRSDGMSFQTLRGFQDVLLRQQNDSSVRLQSNAVVIAVSGLTAENVKAVSDALGRAGVKATLFIESKNLGLSAITEKQILTLNANGHDVESATHTGDDLRAITDAQVALELRQSRKLLEEFTHRPVVAVLYPQGGVNDRVMRIAAESGYLFGVSAGAEKSFMREQLLRLPSFQIFSAMSADEVSTLAKGS